MINTEIKVDGLPEVTGSLEAIEAAMQDKSALHSVIATAAEELTRAHLQNLNSRSPNTGFFGQAAQSVESEFDEDSARVRVPYAGIALRYYGGTVMPGKSICSFHPGELTKALALPTDKVPVRNHRRLSPREAGLLAFLPSKTKGKDGKTVGYLVQGEKKEITRGNNKGKTRIVPLKGGSLMYVLRSAQTFLPDNTVLPTEAALTNAGAAAAQDYIASFEPSTSA